MRCLLVAIQLSKLPSEVHYSVRSSFSAGAASRYLFSIKFYRLSEQHSQLLCHSTKGIDRRSDFYNKQRKQKKTFPTSEELTDRPETHMVVPLTIIRCIFCERFFLSTIRTLGGATTHWNNTGSRLKDALKFPYISIHPSFAENRKLLLSIC